jgi:tetratricopeptide (TPR) repeat protein
VDLAVFYPFPEKGVPGWQVVPAVLLLLALTGTALLWAKRFPFLLVGWFFYLGTLVPVIGIVQVGDQARADRYTYVPLIGIFLVVAWGTAGLGSSRRSRQYLGGLAGLTLVLLMFRTWTEIRHWHDGLTLWTHTLQVNESSLAYSGRGCFLLRQGKFNSAERDFLAALRLVPTDSESLNGMGVILGMRGRTAQAEELFRESLAHCPDNPDAHANLGRCLLIQGKRAEAAQQFREALRLRPGWSAAEDHLRIAEASNQNPQ